MRIIILSACIFLTLMSDSFAWNDTITHRTISKYAALNFFNDPLWLDSILKGKPVSEWIEEGAEREDDWRWYRLWDSRSKNHFHAPTRSLETGGFKQDKGMSTLLWAQDGDLQEGFVGGDWSWGKVRNDFYNYVTATSKEAEDDSLVAMLQGIGYQMHLVQDMSQPNHVRDDAHIPDGFGWKWISNGFETWAEA